MSVLKLKTSLICNGPESDKAKAEYLLQTRDTIPADVCTHLVLAVHQGLVRLVLHVLGEPGHSGSVQTLHHEGLHLEPLGEDDAVQQTRQARTLLLQELTIHTVEFRRELHITSATEAKSAEATTLHLP